MKNVFYILIFILLNSCSDEIVLLKLPNDFSIIKGEMCKGMSLKRDCVGAFYPLFFGCKIEHIYTSDSIGIVMTTNGRIYMINYYIEFYDEYLNELDVEARDKLLSSNNF